MNYGLYLSASGVLTNMTRQDVFANNLANANTVGFRKDLAILRQRDAAAIENRLDLDVRHDLLDKLGGGALFGPHLFSMKAGPMQEGTDSDVALVQEDTFLAVAYHNKQTGQEEVRLTRDGRFTRSTDGYLVLAANGRRVLDGGDNPITLDANAPFSLTDDGSVWQNGERVARLQITGVKDPQQLIKRGENLLGFAEGKDDRVARPGATVRPGFVEASNVDPVTTLMDLINATKAVTSNANLIRYHDTLMDRAVNVLGRVA